MGTRWAIATRRWGASLGVFCLVLLGLALAGCSGASDESSGEHVSDAISALPDAKAAASRLQGAVAGVEEIDKRLSNELGQIGPALTDAQRQQYVSAFGNLTEIQAARADYLTSAIALDGELDAIVNDPDNLRTVMNGVTVTVYAGRAGAIQQTVYGPRDLYDEYKLLAGTPVASGALRFAAHLLGHDPAYAAVGVDDQHVIDEILSPALPRSLAQLLIDTQSDTSALDQLSRMVGPAKDIAVHISEGLDKFLGDAEIADLTPDELRLRGVSRAMLAAGTVLAIWEVGDGVASALHGDFKAAIKDLVDGGPDAVAGLAQATTLFRQVIFGQRATEWAAKVGQVAARIGAGIGIVLDSIELIGDLKNWNASDADKVEVLSDLLGIAGGVAVLLGAGPVGAILAVVAIGVNLFADFLRGQAEQAKEHDEKDACLTAMGMDATLRDTLLHAWSEALTNLRDVHHFTPEHIQWLANTDASVIRGEGALAVRFIGMEVLESIFALSGDQPYDFLVAVAGDESDPLKRRYMVDSMLRDMEFTGYFTADMSRADALAWFDDEAQGIYVSDPAALAAWQKAFQNGRAYVAAH